MHEQLIEALREEAKSLQKDGYGLSAAGDVPARFVEMLENIADRLEGGAKSSEPRPKHLPKGLHVPPSSSWSVMGDPPAHMHDGYITKPTAPPVIAGHSDVDALDIRFSVSHATPDPANDDDEPLLPGDSCETPTPSFHTLSGTLNGEKVSVCVNCATGEAEIVGAEPDAGSTSDDDEPLTAAWLESVGFCHTRGGDMEMTVAGGSIHRTIIRGKFHWLIRRLNGTEGVPIKVSGPADIEAAIRLLGGVEQ